MKEHLQGPWTTNLNEGVNYGHNEIGCAAEGNPSIATANNPYEIHQFEKPELFLLSCSRCIPPRKSNKKVIERFPRRRIRHFKRCCNHC